MPRIRNLKELVFYKAEKSVSYKHIEALFHDGKDCQQVIDWKLIQTHWFDMMRVVLSIREGKISSATILRNWVIIVVRTGYTRRSVSWDVLCGRSFCYVIFRT
jgi:Transposase.